MSASCALEDSRAPPPCQDRARARPPKTGSAAPGGLQVGSLLGLSDGPRKLQRRGVVVCENVGGPCRPVWEGRGLAYHYATSLELARAVGQTEQAADLRTLGTALACLWRASARSVLTRRRRSRTWSRSWVSPFGTQPETLALFGQAAGQEARYAERRRALRKRAEAFRQRRSLPACARTMVMHKPGAQRPRRPASLDAPSGGVDAA